MHVSHEDLAYVFSTGILLRSVSKEDALIRHEWGNGWVILEALMVGRVRGERCIYCTISAPMAAFTIVRFRNPEMRATQPYPSVPNPCSNSNLVVVEQFCEEL